MSKPLIYIAALRRTGSTVLSEALTLPPHSYVFREPRLPLGRFRPKRNDIDFFGSHNVDLAAFRDELSSVRRERGLALFKEKVLPRLAGVVDQVGVKEISHAGWHAVVEAFPDMRVVLLGRDPRDIFVSMHAKYFDPGRELRWEGPFTPETVAEDLQGEFGHQRDMAESANCLKVRYEDFCSDASVYEEIKRFVGSDVPKVGMVGGLSREDYNRLTHDGRISNRMVDRWRTAGEEVAQLAQRTRELLPDYCEFWGY